VTPRRAGDAIRHAGLRAIDLICGRIAVAAALPRVSGARRMAHGRPAKTAVAHRLARAAPGRASAI